MLNENNKLPPNDSIPFWLLALLAIALGIGIYLRFEALGYVLTNEWVTRDFERAFNIMEGNYIPLAGPELDLGGRLPGPFLYFFLTIPLFFDPSYESIFLFNFLINVASLIGVFFIVKKYFNFFVASITTAAFALHFLPICAVLFPVNPSFIFPFVTLYLWFFLEFFISRNHRAIPPLVLSICLGMQIHYSVATYILAPVILAIIFKIKIPIKTIVASLILIVLCFSPYLLYKQMMFFSTKLVHHLTVDEISLKNMIKTVSLHHMLDYLQGESTKSITETKIPYAMATIYNKAGLISFYVLLGIVLIKIRKNGWQVNRKELYVLAYFYFPMVLYGILNPYTAHFWYSYIFIIPQALVIGLCTYSIHDFLSRIQIPIYRNFEKIFIALILASFVLPTIVLIKHTNKSQKNINKITVTNRMSMPHKKMRGMLRSIMISLNLSPDEFYQHVYFLDFHVSSRRILELSGVNAFEKSGNNQIKKEKPCFFIKLNDKDNKPDVSTIARFTDLFLKDSTIKILSKEYISMRKQGVSHPLEVYTYKPLFSQPCYSNNFNMFVVDEKIRDLLVNAKDVLRDDEVVSVKPISIDSGYNSKQELEYFEGSYVINHRVSQSPFGFNLSIKKVDENFLIRGSIQSYYFHRSLNWQPKKMDLVFRSTIPFGPKEWQLEGPTGVTFVERNETRLNILTEHTLVSEGNVNRSYGWSYNQYWFREYKIPSVMVHGKKYIYLAWSQYAPNHQDQVANLQVKLSPDP